MSAYALAPGVGETIWMFDSLDTVKASAETTGGQMSVFEFADSAGSAVPMHVNERWDQGFYVLEGDYTFVLGEDMVASAQGGWVFVPRGIAVGWRCNSKVGRVLAVSVPGGFEAFYREAGLRVANRSDLPPVTEPDPESLAPVAARHGIRIVGPAPGSG